MAKQKFKINNLVQVDSAFLEKIYNQGEKKYSGQGIVMETNYDPRFVKILAKRARGMNEDPLWVMTDHLTILVKDCGHFQLA